MAREVATFNLNGLFVLQEQEIAMQVLKEKRYITDEGIVLSKFCPDPFLYGPDDVIPFDKAALYFDRNVENGKCWLVLAGNEETPSGQIPMLGRIAIDNADVLNLVYTQFDLFPGAEKLLAQMLLYKPAMFYDAIDDCRKKPYGFLPRYFINGASHPAAVEVDSEKVDLMPGNLGMGGIALYRWFKSVMYSGSASPARVVSLSPLVISVYSYDLKTAVLTQHDDYLAKTYDLNVGDKLLAVCNYSKSSFFDAPNDIVLDLDKNYYWGDVKPKIALFYARNEAYCKFRVNLFTQQDWALLDEATKRHNEMLPGVTRKAYDCL